MPRPIQTSGPPPENLPPKIEFPIASVDAPDAYFTGVRLRVEDQTVVVLNRNFQEWQADPERNLAGSRYALEEFSMTQINGGVPGQLVTQITGLYGGQPFVATTQEGCSPCQKAQRSPKTK
jgi:hypothetical protein